MNLDLYTKRLHLRPFRPSDVDLDIEMATDPDVMKYFDGVVTEQEIVEESRNFVRRCGGGCIGVWTVVDRMTYEKLGEVYLTPLPIDAEDTEWELIQGEGIPDAEIEIGYLFKQSAWGKGIATEASQRLLQFAFEETPLCEVVAVTQVGNVASDKVLIKCGFISEGMRRAYADEFASFRITQEQWSALQLAIS